VRKRSELILHISILLAKASKIERSHSSKYTGVDFCTITDIMLLSGFALEGSWQMADGRRFESTSSFILLGIRPPSKYADLMLYNEWRV
jgi:hypothetical protein